jgi:RsiW-degrading membrane proteinase PrsW (M82 family)|tara:strand:+ start:246 stop:539 length:294 start_codon:yes stop_codon:yes gene_type:complete
MVISGLLLIIFYISHTYIVAWINFYNNQDERFGNSLWRWTYDYKVIGKRDVSDLDDISFVRKRRIRNRTITFMYCNFFIGFFVLMSFVSNLLILILQ